MLLVTWSDVTSSRFRNFPKRVNKIPVPSRMLMEVVIWHSPLEKTVCHELLLRTVSWFISGAESSPWSFPARWLDYRRLREVETFLHNGTGTQTGNGCGTPVQGRGAGHAAPRPGWLSARPRMLARTGFCSWLLSGSGYAITPFGTRRRPPGPSGSVATPAAGRTTGPRAAHDPCIRTPKQRLRLLPDLLPCLMCRLTRGAPAAGHDSLTPRHATQTSSSTDVLRSLLVLAHLSGLAPLGVRALFGNHFPNA